MGVARALHVGRGAVGPRSGPRAIAPHAVHRRPGTAANDRIFPRGSTRRDQSVSPLSQGRCLTTRRYCGSTRTTVASLLSLPLVERARLLEGNWKIRPAAGLY